MLNLHIVYILYLHMYIVYKYLYIYIYLFIFFLLLLRHALHMRKKDEEINRLQRQKQDVWKGWRKWVLEAERRGLFVRENQGPVFSNSFFPDDSDEHRIPVNLSPAYDPDDFDDSDEDGPPLKDL